MSLVSAFYEAVYGVSKGIGRAFNFASGNTALDKRYLDRSISQENWSAGLGMGFGLITAIVGGAILFSTLSPLIAWPLFLAVTAEAALLPAQLMAAYEIGKDESNNRRERKPAAG